LRNYGDLKWQDAEKIHSSAFFWKNDRLHENFQNSVPKGHCLTDQRVVFKFPEIWPTGNWYK